MWCVQVLFDHMGCLKRYESVQDILKEFFELRLHYYKLRKDWLVGSLGAEASKLSNQARFVLEKIEGKISIGQEAGAEKVAPLRRSLLNLCSPSPAQKTNPSVS